MDTQYRLILSFSANESQIEKLKRFCYDKIIPCDSVLSVRVKIDEDLLLSLSVFANRPDIFFGIYSSKEDKILSSYNMGISDDKLEKVLKYMDLKLAHAASRKEPVVNKDLAIAWISYINKHNYNSIIPL